jgi:hypothetical protein
MDAFGSSAKMLPLSQTAPVNIRAYHRVMPPGLGSVLAAQARKLVAAISSCIALCSAWTRPALACLALLLLATVQTPAADARRVLLLHAFGHPYSPWSDMAGSFRAELVKSSTEPIDLYEV